MEGGNMRLETLSEMVAVYDDLFKRGKEVIAELNPCKIQIADGKVSCTAVRGEVGGSYNGYQGQTSGNLCCGGCKYLTAKGCKVNCLACKLWLCACFGSVYTKNTPKILVKLSKLKAEANRKIPFMLGIRKSRAYNIEIAKEVIENRRRYGRSGF